MKSLFKSSLGLIFIAINITTIVSKTIHVPGDFAEIADAVAAAAEGDVVIIHPGYYVAKGILIDKRITVTSEWYLTGDESIIDQTIINAGEVKLFSIVTNDFEISGLRIEDGDHTLDIEARVTVKYCHFVRHKDAVSMEGNGGGYVGYCSFTESSASKYDDAIDCDIGEDGPNEGHDIVIEHNFIDGTDDDGIEIRLFTFDNPIRYDIHDNVIMNTGAAGIQLISYDVPTGKSFNIHRNVFVNCKTGLGCMEGSNTRENLAGAELMDEEVLFYNNTMINNQMGATGANNVIALNNIAIGGSVGGFKNFNSANSVVDYNLFFSNNAQNLTEIDPGVGTGHNLMDIDPSIDIMTFELEDESICIDAGTATYLWNGDSVLVIASGKFKEDAPDLGAREKGDSLVSSLLYPNRSSPEFSINPPYPNPFYASTQISFSLSVLEHVQLKIFDIKGRTVSTLVDQQLAAGTHSYYWNRSKIDDNSTGKGIYMARLQVGVHSSTVQLILLE